MNHILALGGSRFIGQHVARELLAHRYEVHILHAPIGCREFATSLPQTRRGVS